MNCILIYLPPWQENIYNDCIPNDNKTMFILNLSKIQFKSRTYHQNLTILHLKDINSFSYKKLIVVAPLQNCSDL